MIFLADYLHGIHEQVKQTISDNNDMYKTLVDTHHKRVLFEVGDLVWAILTCKSLV